MLLEEARWIGRALTAMDPTRLYPMANIGSSTAHFRTVVQPYIDQFLFASARSCGGVVVHVDLKKAPGVDLVGNVTDPEIQEKLRGLNIKSILCCNLLEHVQDRQRVCACLLAAIPPGGYIIVSVPYLFPYHEDPIDTMYRPTIDELTQLFPGTDVREASVIRVSRFRYDMNSSYSALFRLLLPLLLPWYKPRNWIRAVRRARELILGYRVTCVVLTKSG